MVSLCGVHTQRPTCCQIIARGGIHTYTCRVPLIFLFVVEWHFPDRVVRQFGGFQNIPLDVGFDERLHKIDGKTKRGDWRYSHARLVEIWDNRMAYTSNYNPWQLDRNCSQGYQQWFNLITRRLVGNPAHRNLDG